MPLLLKSDSHAVYYFRDLSPKGAVQANQYLIVDSSEALLLDLGGKIVFNNLLSEVGRVVPINSIKVIFATHHDPDIVSALTSWTVVCPKAKVYLPKLWSRFLPHIFSKERSWDFIVEVPDEGTEIRLGRTVLKVIPAHYLHSARNFTLYDPASKILFSGDIGSALLPPEKDADFIDNIEDYLDYMKYFHQTYMASNKACQKWVSLVENLEIEYIAPQHGAIIRGKQNVEKFLQWLKQLKCGVDLL